MHNFKTGIPIFEPEQHHIIASRIALNSQKPRYVYENIDRYRDLHYLAKHIKNDFHSEIRTISQNKQGSKSQEALETTASQEYGIIDYSPDKVYAYIFEFLDKIFNLDMHKKFDAKLLFTQADQESFFNKCITKKTIFTLIDALAICSDAHVESPNQLLIQPIKKLISKLTNPKEMAGFLKEICGIITEYRAKPLNFSDELYEEITGLHS